MKRLLTLVPRFSPHHHTAGEIVVVVSVVKSSFRIKRIMSSTTMNTTTRSNLIRQYVEPGACIATLQNGNAIMTVCALEPSWCPPSAGIAGRTSDEFVPSRQLHKNGSQILCPVGSWCLVGGYSRNFPVLHPLSEVLTTGQ